MKILERFLNFIIWAIHDIGRAIKHNPLTEAWRKIDYTNFTLTPMADAGNNLKEARKIYNKATSKKSIEEIIYRSARKKVERTSAVLSKSRAQIELRNRQRQSEYDLTLQSMRNHTALSPQNNALLLTRLGMKYGGDIRMMKKLFLHVVDEVERGRMVLFNQITGSKNNSLTGFKEYVRREKRIYQYKMPFKFHTCYAPMHISSGGLFKCAK